MLENYSSVKGKGVSVFFFPGDKNYALKTREYLEKAVVDLSKYFQAEKPLGLRAILVPDRKEYERMVVNLLGVDIEIPSNPGRIAQPQGKDLVFLSPSAYRDHSIYEYRPEEYKGLIFHEATHVFEELLSPDIELVPRWWSEGLAVFLSGQWKEYCQLNFRKNVENGILQGEIPSFREVERKIDLAYDWGWTLVMFLELSLGSGSYL